MEEIVKFTITFVPGNFDPFVISAFVANDACTVIMKDQIP